MLDLSIDVNLRKAAGTLALGVIEASVKVEKHNDELWEEIQRSSERVSSLFSLDKIGEIPEVRALRDAYRSIGKDPLRYRGSNEALIRRILQGKGLYKINSVVDINNLVSIESRHSVGSYDASKIEQPVVLRAGFAGESYKGIGKETINIAELPVFADRNGPFGSPTSDSERAMITSETAKLLMVIISFSGKSELQGTTNRAIALLEKYAHAEHVESRIVE